MSTYLVTGAAGFIGARVSELLLEAGHTVWGLDCLNDAYAVRLKAWRLGRLLERPGFHFERLDITSRADLQRLAGERDLKQVAGVINLAARAGVRQSVADPWAYVDANVTGTLNLLEVCRAHAIPKFVLASSSSLYGAHNPRPYREDADTSRPLSPYAASKQAAEALCYTYHSLHGLDVTVFRYFTVYGPAGRPDMSPFRFTQWISEGKPVVIFGDGSQSRDFTYVDDIARGTVAGLKMLGHQVINLGSDRPVALLDVVREIEALVGCRAQLEFHPRHAADVTATWADIEKARACLAWQPETSLAQGLHNLVAWYSAERTWAQWVPTGN